ncbi:tetraacyldisaccharide 4'-kinase [Flavobacterium luteum]|uniref:Tetraacyldisaccharide 4'-kinase n=1 Tax=Flavobacterium luteum TaxID=2026654 RepID=A0A7J5ABX7_9FLAO|nr:tetraacyldisaccharide 4'-kinase [Flavobacterium luteum]KAB1155077.1 tetraacyldisaccharide 4'-kinase [Flavobacterium luteum]
MILLRKILFPFAVLYGWIAQFRNFLYDKGFLKSYSFDLPIIAVGNLSVGGTGKTPQIEYLIRLLSANYKIATLSRGYKRKSEGFVLADDTSTAAILGDEPYQFYKKFPNIQVAVDADRKNGIEQLLSLPNKPNIILLDDAFQHRKVKAGFYILLTSYDDLFCDDYILPTGNLRESRSGAKRADCIIVTKCPKAITDFEQNEIKEKLDSTVPLFFSCIEYDDCIFSSNESKKVNEIKDLYKLLIAGIAKPKSFFDFLKNQNDISLTFPDHHHFTASDILTIKNIAKDSLIITTEKDYVRLKDCIPINQLFYLPIKTSFISNKTTFDSIISDYLKITI